MKNDSDIQKLGFLYVLLGILIILSLLAFAANYSATKALTDLAYQFGTAIIGVGIVAVILQFNDWKKYFQHRLKDVVIERSYLESLSDQELSKLQVDALKVKYKSTDIDKEGSFLDYLQKRIQDYICYPYRENIVTAMKVEEDLENNDLFIVTDSISYLCRSNAGDIQEEIKWYYEPGEFYTVDDLSLNVRCPNEDKSSCNESCANKKTCEDGSIVMDFSTLKQDKYKAPQGIEGFFIKISDILKPRDMIRIEFNSIYRVEKGRIFSWAMTHPSRNISFTVIFPKGYDLNEFIGGLEPKEYTSRHSDNMYIFTHNGWLLPRAGLAWTLNKKFSPLPKRI